MAIALRDANYLSLATFRKTGLEVCTPVWFAEEDGKIFVFSNEEAGKVKRLRHSTRARIAPCDMRGNILGEWREAQAHLLQHGDEMRLAHAALRRKYGWQLAVLDFFACLFRRKDRRAYIVVQLTEADL
jgi:uncharacterized protein